MTDELEDNEEETRLPLHSGWDIIQTNPGLHESIKCRVCNEEMEVKRAVMGATGFAESLSGRKHLHDTFTCKHAQKKWHRQVRKLKEEIESTPSAKLAAIYQAEIDEILASKKATKELAFDF